MRELWWLIRGSIRFRLTGADPERTLRRLMETIRMEDVCRVDHLTVEFTVARQDIPAVETVANRYGDRLEILHRMGFPQIVEKWLRYPVVLMTVLMLIAASLWLPGRVLFFRVEGNETIPRRLILEEAAASGLSFGVSREAVRSEQIKNRLLEAMPQLSWVGVNTSGMAATVTVQERQIQPEEKVLLPGNIVASADGIVTSVTATAGTPLVKPGDGVQAGQTLISGYTDLGLCTHVEAAEGEIYALTERRTAAVLPRSTRIRSQEWETVKKYSLILGKNRINFYSDSGILHAGCGKMTKIRVLTLPGGWTLPAALMVECYTLSEPVSVDRSAQQAEAMLEQAARAELEQQMIAGQIRSGESAFSEEEHVYRLTLRCQCHEMIGRRSSGIMTEGETNDGENGERGTG